jgi:hypothetical protein
MLVAATVSFLPFLPVVVSPLRSLRELPDDSDHVTNRRPGAS